MKHFARKFFFLFILTGTLIVFTPPMFSGNVVEHLERGGGLFSRGDYSGAENQYRKALQENPSDRYAYLGLGLSLSAQNKLVEAEKTLEKLTQFYPDFAPAYYNLGVVREKKGDMAGARNAYEQFIRYAQGDIPADPEVRLRLRRMGLL